MLSCRTMTRLISDGLDRRLSWWERLGLGIHLLGCGPCRRFRRAAQWLHARLPSASTGATLSSQARQRIQRSLEEAIEG